MKSKLLIAVLCGLACAPAFGQFTYIVDSRSGGQHYSDFSAPSGWATSTGNVNAPGSGVNIGSMYSGTGTFFGPSRYAQFNFTPATAGYYNIALSWPSSAGETATAVNLYTGAATGGPTDSWGNAGGPVGVIASGTMDMYYKNVGVWNSFTTVQLNSGTAYHVGIYGSRLAIAPENRVVAGGARFMAATPGAVVNGGPSDGAINIPLTGAGNDLSWTAGSFDSFFDIFVELDLGSPIRVASDLPGTTLSFDPDSLNLLPGTTYYWSVTAKNVDVTTSGPVWSFTTVPEPSTFGLGLLGGFGMAAWIARRRTA